MSSALLDFDYRPSFTVNEVPVGMASYVHLNTDGKAYAIGTVAWRNRLIRKGVGQCPSGRVGFEQSE